MIPEGRWDPVVREGLEALIHREAGRGRVVVMDFDNTIFRGDIGEELLQLAAEKGIVTGQVLEEYERKLSQTAHHEGDPAPYADGYAWAVESLAGLTPVEVVRLTDEAAGRVEARRRDIFFPEVVSLIAALQKTGFSLRIVSASSVWSVRRMVSSRLNPLLEERFGCKPLEPEQVRGIEVYLRRKTDGAVYTESQAMEHEPGYAPEASRVRDGFELTDRIVHPLPAYAGKIAVIIQSVGYERPVLIVGDSPNDIPMLGYAENRLWLARLEKPKYFAPYTAAFAEMPPETRMIQPVSEESDEGLVPPGAGVIEMLSPKAQDGLGLLHKTKYLSTSYD